MSTPFNPALKATYTNTTKPASDPTHTHTFTHTINSTSSKSSSWPQDSVESKTAFLSSLRSSTKTLQNEVNAFLTERMEEDKAVGGAAAEGNGNAKNEKKNKRKGVVRDDEEEEENYGEEKIDED